MSRDVVLIHGYSDKGASFRAWRDKLCVNPTRDVTTIGIGNYRSLTDEVTIKDLADGLDRALRDRFRNDDQEFDAIVHSTGMLVLREWFIRDRRRLKRLKHLVALAPATFGSPLARQGRSWLGAIFKGQKHLGPDFLASGDAILDGLELASPYTWDLAGRDIFNEQPYFDDSPDTPYVFIFCGTDAYTGIRELATSPGMDGTVRWAGAGFNTRKIVLDLTRVCPGEKRIAIEKWMATDIPVHLMPGMNHGTILSDPTDELVGLVKKSLSVASEEEFAAWLKEADAQGRAARTAEKQGAWQQVIVRCSDQRGDPIRDFHLRLYDGDEVVPDLDDEHVDVYSRDHSYRCFHFDVARLLDRRSLAVKVMALSGSTWIDFQGFGLEQDSEPAVSPTANARWDATFDLTEVLKHDRELLAQIHLRQIAFDNQRLFAPFTTTLVEIRLDRDAYPLDLTKISDLFGWDAP
jgi:hypothetical protein